MSPSAAVAMVVEKATTFAESAADSGNTVAKGEDLVGFAAAALTPNGVRPAAFATETPLTVDDRHNAPRVNPTAAQR